MIFELLADAGVEVIFGYPGGAALPLYDALHQQCRIRHILVRHEQAAVHAAEGYARSTGRIGVVMVTSGPGATNTITGLADALMDSIPVLCLTGQVNSWLIGTEGFQEANTVALSRAATKYNCGVTKPEDLAPLLRRALHIAQSGRPGPVLIDIPKDIQQHSAPREAFDATLETISLPKLAAIEPNAISRITDLIQHAKRPLLYTGGGVINSGVEASRSLRDFARLTGIPVTSTLMGLGAFPASDPQWIGMPGMHGTYEANLAMHGCDLMICIGARFDDRVTGRLNGFAPDAVKVHVDIDQSQLGRLVPVEVGVAADCGAVLKLLVADWGNRHAPDISDWWTKIAEWRRECCLDYAQGRDIILPQHAISRLYDLTLDHNAIITTEVGQHQMWAAQHFGFEHPNRWLTSGGLGTMGYGLPAAIGAQIANPDALVIDIAGEASIQMNIQELSTAVQYGLPVKIFIINNRHMGMVRQWQDMHYGGRRSQSYSESLPDFVGLAEAYGWTGLRVTDPARLDDTIEKMITTSGPVLVDCNVAQLENCYPMMPSGAAHNEILLR